MRTELIYMFVYNVVQKKQVSRVTFSITITNLKCNSYPVFTAQYR